MFPEPILDEEFDDPVEDLNDPLYQLDFSALIMISNYDHTKAGAFKVVINNDEVVRLHPKTMERLNIALDKKRRKASLFASFLPKSRQELKKFVLSQEVMESKNSCFTSSLFLSSEELEKIANNSISGEMILSDFDKVVI